jgi:RNA polymerase sigma-70 factor (ECF subfamily)
VSSIPDVLLSPALANDYTDLQPEELLRVCADLRNAAAWDEFIHRFHPAIYRAVLRTCRRYGQFGRDLYDDLVQDTYLRLSAKDAKALREFVPRQPGSAYCYVQVIAMRVTQDYLKRKDILRTEELPPDQPDVAAPDKAEWLATRLAIDDVLRKRASERDRQIFWLYYLQGMTAKEIAAIPHVGLTVKGVEAVLQRLKGLF